MSSSPTPADVPPLPREELLRCPATVLKDEGEGAARVVRYDLPDGPVVLKEWAPRSRLLALWARAVLGREIRHYRLLDGTPGIPRYRGRYGPTSFLIEWIDGRPLRRGLPPALLEAGLDGLGATLDALHARRFVHLDLHQKLNAIIAPDGRVWLVDLGQGVDCSRGLLRRLLFPALAAIDRRAVTKFRARYAPHTIVAEERDKLVERHGRRRGRTWKELRRRLVRRLVGQR